MKGLGLGLGRGLGSEPVRVRDACGTKRLDTKNVGYEMYESPIGELGDLVFGIDRTERTTALGAA